MSRCRSTIGCEQAGAGGPYGPLELQVSQGLPVLRLLCFVVPNRNGRPAATY
jgi:hypothetical protein